MPENEDIIEYANVVGDDDNSSNTDNQDDNQNNDQNDTQDREVETDQNQAIQKLDNVNVAQLEAFTSVEQIKQFAIQMGISGSPESVAQRIVRGRELGLPAMMAFDNIYIFNGRATLGVHAINFLLRRAGYEIKTIRDNQYLYTDGTYGDFVKDGQTVGRYTTIQAKWRSKITQEIETEEFTYSWLEATNAGLTTKDTWKKYGRQLLWARCLVFLARRIAADALMGFYETSEAADIDGKNYDVTEEGNVINID